MVTVLVIYKLYVMQLITLVAVGLFIFVALFICTTVTDRRTDNNI